MQIESISIRRLGAEDRKPKTTEDCAREENRASYAVCSGQEIGEML
jgi:hypothetical protein